MRPEESTPFHAGTDAAALVDRLQKLRNLLPAFAQEAATARREAARLRLPNTTLQTRLAQLEARPRQHNPTSIQPRIVPAPLASSGNSAYVRDTATTGAPASARAVAMAAPRPRLAPTTMVVLPDWWLMFVLLVQLSRWSSRSCGEGVGAVLVVRVGVGVVECRERVGRVDL